MKGSCCGGSEGSAMSCCRGCGSPATKGHGKACFMWFMTKLLVVLGLVAWAGAMYLQYTEMYWYMYDSLHLYLKAIVLFLLALICRMAYKDRKKMLFMKMVHGDMMGAGCGCGESSAGGCCGEGEEEHKH